MNLSNIKEQASCRTSRLPDEVVSFNPSSDKDLEKLLSKVGPEGLYEISWKLQKVAQADMDSAMNPQEEEDAPFDSTEEALTEWEENYQDEMSFDEFKDKYYKCGTCGSWELYEDGGCICYAR